MGTALKFLGIGWFVALCLLGGTMAGLWLDEFFGLSPVITIIGLITGLIMAGIGTYRMLISILTQSSDPMNRKQQ